MKKVNDLVDFYHYTKASAIDSIIALGVLLESEGGAAKHQSTGVYGTALPPLMGKRKIARNNWMKGWKEREQIGSVDYVIHLRIPKKKLRELNIPSRQLYVHRGPIRLDDYEWSVEQL